MRPTRRKHAGSCGMPASVRKRPKMNETAAEDEVTLDAFHRGAFWLVQPARRGHRAGVDAMMLAAAVPGSFAGKLADLGSGAGAAGLAVAARCPCSTVTLIDRSPEMLDYAR